MSKTTNNFAIAGFVVNDAEVRECTNSNIARFGLSVKRTEKKSEEEKSTSAILNIETWCKKDDTQKLDLMKKGMLIQVEGFFKPEQYTDKDGKEKHVIKLVATKVEAVEI